MINNTHYTASDGGVWSCKKSKKAQKNALSGSQGQLSIPVCDWPERDTKYIQSGKSAHTVQNHKGSNRGDISANVPKFNSGGQLLFNGDIRSLSVLNIVSEQEPIAVSSGSVAQ